MSGLFHLKGYGGMTRKFKMYVRRGGLDHDYVCKEGGGSEKKNV